MFAWNFASLHFLPTPAPRKKYFHSCLFRLSMSRRFYEFFLVKIFLYSNLYKLSVLSHQLYPKKRKIPFDQHKNNFRAEKKHFRNGSHLIWLVTCIIFKFCFWWRLFYFRSYYNLVHWYVFLTDKFCKIIFKKLFRLCPRRIWSA
jgi:hypothetical protein